jgi:hypothetical protein
MRYAYNWISNKRINVSKKFINTRDEIYVGVFSIPSVCDDIDYRRIHYLWIRLGS